MSGDPEAAARQLLARLARKDATIVRDAGGSVRLVPAKPGNGSAPVDAGLMASLVGRGLIASGDDGVMRITAAGAALVRRCLAGADDFARQHQDHGAVVLEDAAFGRRRVTVNHDESPLTWLRRRKECGRPCQTCAAACQMNAIKPTGEIIATECQYCLECQVLYWDDHRCPPLVDKHGRRRRQQNKPVDDVIPAVPIHFKNSAHIDAKQMTQHTFNPGE